MGLFRCGLSGGSEDLSFAIYHPSGGVAGLYYVTLWDGVLAGGGISAGSNTKGGMLTFTSVTQPSSGYYNANFKVLKEGWYYIGSSWSYKTVNQTFTIGLARYTASLMYFSDLEKHLIE